MIILPHPQQTHKKVKTSSLLMLRNYTKLSSVFSVISTLFYLNLRVKNYSLIFSPTKLTPNKTQDYLTSRVDHKPPKLVGTRVNGCERHVKIIKAD